MKRLDQELVKLETARNKCRRRICLLTAYHRRVPDDHRRTSLQGLVANESGFPIHRRANDDFGILKWPTLAVCFGPPLDTTNFYSGFEHELGSGGWGWTGEPRWSCSSRFGWSMSLG